MCIFWRLFNMFMMFLNVVFVSFNVSTFPMYFLRYSATICVSVPSGVIW